jgi:uncharacterized membrane protein
MADQEVGGFDDPVAELVATLGLLLMFVAVIGLVMGVTSFGLGGDVFAVVCCAIAVISFVGSVACFVVDGKRLDAAKDALPFPSMLRNR